MDNMINKNLFIYIILLMAFIIFITPHMMYPRYVYLLNDTIREGLDTLNTFKISDMAAEKSFCKIYEPNPSLLNDKSKILTKNNCMNTSCTVWTSNNTCVAGSKNGPVYNTNAKNERINIDYYYYLNKCYGKCDKK